MTEDDLITLRDYLVMTRKPFGVGKHKAIAVLSCIGGLVAVGSAFPITVLFPSPVTVGRSLRKLKKKQHNEIRLRMI